MGFLLRINVRWKHQVMNERAYGRKADVWSILGGLKGDQWVFLGGKRGNWENP